MNYYLIYIKSCGADSCSDSLAEYAKSLFDDPYSIDRYLFLVKTKLDIQHVYKKLREDCTPIFCECDILISETTKIYNGSDFLDTKDTSCNINEELKKTQDKILKMLDNINLNNQQKFEIYYNERKKKKEKNYTYSQLLKDLGIIRPQK